MIAPFFSCPRSLRNPCVTKNVPFTFVSCSMLVSLTTLKIRVSFTKSFHQESSGWSATVPPPTLAALLTLFPTISELASFVQPFPRVECCRGCWTFLESLNAKHTKVEMAHRKVETPTYRTSAWPNFALTFSQKAVTDSGLLISVGMISTWMPLLISFISSRTSPRPASFLETRTIALGPDFANDFTKAWGKPLLLIVIRSCIFRVIKFQYLNVTYQSPKALARTRYDDHLACHAVCWVSGVLENRVISKCLVGIVRGVGIVLETPTTVG